MMKAKVKATGEIVNVYFRSPLWINGDTNESYFPKEIESVWVEEREKPSKNIDYWERLKHQYAGMAMQGMVRTIGHDRMYPPEKIAIYAEACAHALVEKMKEERK
jgi:hypothetical protein